MSRFKGAVFLQLAGFALALAAIAGAVRYFPVVPLLLQVQQKLGAMQFWGAAAYPLLYALGNVLLLPGGVLAVGSGFFFGLWWGFLLNLIGNVVGAAISFQISRKLGRGWVERRFFRHRKWVALDIAIARDGWKIIFLSQVHPLFPTSLLNYLYGITRIRFGPCLLWIALGQAPGLFFYAYLGTLTQFGVRISQGKSHPEAVEYVLWIGGLLLAFAATAALARVALRLLARVEREAQTASAPPAPVPALEPVER